MYLQFGGEMKILAADDQEINRKLLNKTLGQYGKLMIVENGAIAVNKFEDAIRQHNAFSLVLLDIMMSNY